MNDASDAILLEAWRAGDAVAGNMLVGRHAPMVLRFFKRKVSCGAEDLTQRTFLAAVENRGRVLSKHGFRAYLLGIARHELLRTFRRSARPAVTLAAPSTLPSPSRAAARREDEARLLVALRQLPLDLQITLELHYWEDMTTASIAEVLEVAPGTIKWRLSKAREKLAAALEQLPAHTAPRTSDDFGRWMCSIRGAVGSGFDVRSVESTRG